MKKIYLIYKGISFEQNFNINIKVFHDLDEIHDVMNENDLIYIIIDRHTFSIDDYLKVNLYSIKYKTKVLYIYTPIKSFIAENDTHKNQSGVLNVNMLNNQFKSKEELTKKYNTIIFSAHGEGCHLNLNNIVICACREKNNPVKCRKAFNKEVLPLEETNANNYIFLSCNSASFNKELYPTEKNLLFTALEKANYVIVALTPIILREEYANLLEQGILNDINLIDLTLLLNEMYIFQYGEAPFICCSKEVPVLRNFNLTNDKQILKKDIISTDILLIEDECIGKVFRFNDYYISFNQQHFEKCKIIPNRWSEKAKFLYQYLVFIERFYSFLELQNIISIEQKSVNFEIIEKIKKKLFYLSLEINLINISKITNFSKYNVINKGLSLIEKACLKTFIEICNQGSFYDKFEAYVEYCFENQESFFSNHRCTRCHSQLKVTKKLSLFNKSEITKYECPICGVHSIYFGKNDFYNHGYKNCSENKNIFFHEDDRINVTAFRLYDKSKGKIWYDTVMTESTHILVDTNKLNSDVHSYKMICFSNERVVYIHGKFIK